MKKAIPLSILFLGVLLTIPAVNQVHGVLTGTVCIADASSTACPTTPPTFTGPVGTTLTVAVNIQGSDALNDWDVAIQADPSVLSGVSVDLTGNLLSSHGNVVLPLTECINGSGAGCSSIDGPGIVHIVIFDGPGVPAPATGRLFSITYKIVGNSSGVTIGYLASASCPLSSNDSTCVYIVHLNTVDPENLQTATFSNPTTFSVSAIAASLTVGQGSSTMSTITLASLGGFAATLTLSTSIAPLVSPASHTPKATLSSTTVSLSPGGSSTVTLTVSTKVPTPTGSYTITLAVSGGGQSGTVRIPLTVTAK